MPENESFFHRFFAALERGLSWLDSLAKAIGVGVFVAVLVLNFGAIAAGVRGLAEKLPNLVKVSAFGVNVELDPATIEANVRDGAAATNYLRKTWGAVETKNAVEGLKSLDMRELARLVDLAKPSVGLCRYAKGDVDQLYEYATDKSLVQKGLAAIEDREALLARESEERARQTPPGPPPIECYDIQLTKPGFDARTAIVRSFGSAADMKSAASALAPTPVSPSSAKAAVPAARPSR